MESFGIVISCCINDYYLAKACCASIRFFLGNVPVCLIVDGSFYVMDLERTYDIKVIRKEDIQNPFLRETTIGYYSKLLFLWESPWDTFLSLDADTIVWGNPLRHIRFQDYDIIISKPCVGGNSVSEVNSFFFNTQKVEDHFPQFNWRKYQDDYFCSGVYFGRRETFSLDEYKDTRSFVSGDSCEDQSCLNLMVFKAFDENRIRLHREQNHILQLTVPNFTDEELEKRFPISENGPVYLGEDTVIHWCGANQKPALHNAEVYSDPANYFRRKFLEDAFGQTGWRADLNLQLEDLQGTFRVLKRKLGNKLTRFLSQLSE